MTKIAMVANVIARPENLREVEDALVALVEATRAEDGTEMYVLNREADNEHSFWFYELYRDDDALGLHGAGEGMTTMLETTKGMFAEPPMIKVLAPVAAKGAPI